MFRIVLVVDVVVVAFVIVMPHLFLFSEPEPNAHSMSVIRCPFVKKLFIFSTSSLNRKEIQILSDM